MSKKNELRNFNLGDEFRCLIPTAQDKEDEERRAGSNSGTQETNFLLVFLAFHKKLKLSNREPIATTNLRSDIPKKKILPNDESSKLIF